MQEFLKSEINIDLNIFIVIGTKPGNNVKTTGDILNTRLLLCIQWIGNHILMF